MSKIKKSMQSKFRGPVDFGLKTKFFEQKKILGKNFR